MLLPVNDVPENSELSAVTRTIGRKYYANHFCVPKIYAIYKFIITFDTKVKVIWEDYKSRRNYLIRMNLDDARVWFRFSLVP